MRECATLFGLFRVVGVGSCENNVHVDLYPQCWLRFINLRANSHIQSSRARCVSWSFEPTQGVRVVGRGEVEWSGKMRQRVRWGGAWRKLCSCSLACSEHCASPQSLQQWTCSPNFSTCRQTLVESGAGSFQGLETIYAQKKRVFTVCAGSTVNYHKLKHNLCNMYLGAPYFTIWDLDQRVSRGVLRPCPRPTQIQLPHVFLTGAGACRGELQITSLLVAPANHRAGLVHYLAVSRMFPCILCGALLHGPFLADTGIIILNAECMMTEPWREVTRRRATVHGLAEGNVLATGEKNKRKNRQTIMASCNAYVRANACEGRKKPSSQQPHFS